MEKKKVEERVCEICTTNQEDEQHFLLECDVYKSTRDELFKDLEKEKYDVRVLIGDMKKMMDALIGKGLPGRTNRVVEIVMKYIQRLCRIRTRYAKK